MKRLNKLSLLLVFILLLYPLITATPALAIPQPYDPFEITDANLKAVVAKTLQDDYGIDEITEESVNKITSLIAPSAGIKNLRGLEYFKNLKNVDLSNNDISDLGPLYRINVSTVNLDNNNISTIHSLYGTEKLSLRNNKISNLDSMYACYKLTDLDLRDNKIYDISPLSKITTLKSVKLENQKADLGTISCNSNFKMYNTIKSLDNTSIVNIYNLSNEGVYDLNTNSLSWNNITKDTTVTFNFTKEISLGDCKSTFNGTASKTLKFDASLGDYIPVNIPDEYFKETILRTLNLPSDHVITKHDMESITELSGLCNGTTDITGIEYCTNIEKIYFDYNRVNIDFSHLSGLTKLKVLTLRDNKISNISFLKDLPSLTTLVLDDNIFSSISILKNLPTLKYLSMANCNITAIEPLAALSNLEELNIAGNSIRDLKPIKDLTKLNNLDISNNKISDISPLAYLTTIEKLNLNSNRIIDLSPLKDYKDISDNLYARNQEVTLPSKRCGSSLTIKNMAINYDNTPMIPKEISNNGVYNEESNTISWDNLTSDITKLTVNYNDNTSVPIDPTPDFPVEPNGQPKVPEYKIPKGYSCTINIPVTVKDIYETVTIPDEVLRSKILSTLRKEANSNITREDMESITELSHYGDAFDCIKDLSGLEYCTNLKSLTLSSDNIKDISILENLTNLNYLKLDETCVSDITILEKLPNLNTLKLCKNKITDFTALSKLTKLTKLYLYDSNFSDITPLKNLMNLTTLDLTHNKITDINPLYNLTNLETLVLKGNSISDISPLIRLTNIDALDLSSNNISNISALARLTKMKYLNLSYNIISSISPLSSFESLEFLLINNNKIENISPLADLFGITFLVADNNKITDLSPIGALTKGTDELYLKRQTIELDEKEAEGSLTITNPVVDFNNTPMIPEKISHNGIYNKEDNTITWNNLASDTVKLTLSYNNWDSEAPFTSSPTGDPNHRPMPGIPRGYSSTITIPVKITASDDSIVSIADTNLKNAILDELGKDSDYNITRSDMQSLTSLNLSGKEIKDIDVLQLCSNLRDLDLSNNRISNIAPLASLKSIEKVDLSRNKIKDIACLYGATTTTPIFNITDQYIVLTPDVCKNNRYTLDNPIKDIECSEPKEISNGGKFNKYYHHSDSITWDNITKNTTVSYIYKRILFKDLAKKLNAPIINYSCKINKYLRI